MGFRNKHRRGRGGGGGGGHHHHHHHGFGTGEPNGLQPGDDIGNRKSFKVVQHPPDDLGNRKDPDEVEFIPVDDVGNRIDAAPTHEMSGTLMDVDGKGRRRRRPKGVAAPERVGRFFVGGVNPLIATNTPRPFPGKTLEESFGGPSSGSSGQAAHAAQPSAHAANDDRGDDLRDAPRDDMGMPGEPRDDGDFEGEGGRRRRRRGRGGRGDGRFEQVDGVHAQEVSERRAQRFFDFDEDDRFEYTLKTTAEQKRKDAEDAVKNVVTEAGRDGVVLARLIEDGDRPKILVTIDERGPAASVPPERRAHNANEPLFVMGNAALMSLNYLVNKIVNRYPDDRIRLAILPAADERLYLDALADHQKLRRVPGAAGAPAGANGAAAMANNTNNNNNSSSVPTPVVATPQPSKPRSVPAVATPAPIGPAAPPEAFDEAMEKPKPVAKEPELAKAEERIAEKVKHLEEEQSEANDAEEEEEEEEQGEEEAEEEESIDSKPKATPKKKAKAAPKKKAGAATKKAPAKKAAKKAPVVEKATVKKR